MSITKHISIYSTDDLALATLLVYHGYWLVTVRIKIKSLQPPRTRASFILGIPMGEEVGRLLALYEKRKAFVEPRKYEMARAEVVGRMRQARRAAISQAKEHVS